jgi:segregation and condensation protein B
VTRKKSSKSIASQPLFDSERPTLENAELAIPVDPLEDTQRLEPQPPGGPPAPDGRQAHDASDETPTLGPAARAPEAGVATSDAVAGELGGEPEEGPNGAASDAVAGEPGGEPEGDDQVEAARELTQVHLRGLLEALVFASDKPMKTGELARLASAPGRQVRDVMGELRAEYLTRGLVLDEVAGGWLFRTNAQYAPFVRELAGGRPVKLSRAQLETLAIAAYRQPITRPEIDEIRGVDSGATLKLLLERDLVRILGKKDEPGRPLLYGTTTHFLEFFNMKSLKDLPTLREFTELSDESLRVAEVELGAVLPEAAPPAPRPAEREREPDDDDSLRATLEPPPADPADG